MREPHLLRVTAPPMAYAPLAAAVAGEGLRLGWLELADTAPAPLPEAPATALALGVLRAVAVGPGLAVVAKPMRGGPVLRDLLREHFRGCRLVLVAGPGAPSELPSVAPAGGDEGGDEGGEAYLVRAADGGAARRFAPAALAARLRRPRPWEDDRA